MTDHTQLASDDRCKCEPDSWNGTPNSICGSCKPDPIAPAFCMNCEHDVACHDSEGEALVWHDGERGHYNPEGKV